MENKYVVIAAAFLIGLIAGYILGHLKKPVGTLKIYEDDHGMISVFLELERELEDIQNLKSVKLRVEKLPFNEIY